MASKAFLVGINDYVSPGVNDLQGCVNDVRDMANTLVIMGFDPKQMQICTDRRATKIAIINGIKSLLKGAKKGDNLVFYYSGHGSQIPDVSGDESDGKDEVLCPADVGVGEGNFISDDDLRELFKGVAVDVNLEVILDCCHSGTGTRTIDAFMGLPEAKKVRARYLPPPLDYSFHLDNIPDLPVRKLMKPSGSSKDVKLAPTLNHVLWAGCRDNQVSEETEIGGMVRGAFTFNFCEILRRTGGKSSRKTVDRLLTSAISRGGFAQRPQLEASAKELLNKTFM
ncbi:MAG TPA: caspase family protein [Methanothrix sp.]|nr:caspase family protein [Methanothrix sp.]HPT18894.1 caspase family protein [Methanothrix sp.]